MMTSLRLLLFDSRACLTLSGPSNALDLNDAWKMRTTAVITLLITQNYIVQACVCLLLVYFKDFIG